MEPARYVVDPRDPRAPPQAIWDGLSPEERQQIVDSLPSEPEWAAPPEGDVHRRSKNRAAEALEEFFRRTRRRIYVSSELPVYYPDERVFAPDVLAVREVEGHDRTSWIVSAEGRGLDFVLEVHAAGSRRKDFDGNVQRYARLRIPEYFAFDPVRGHLAGWRLPHAEASAYERIVPQGGRWPSAVLELDLALTDAGLRFFHGSAELLDPRDLVDRLSRMVDDAARRAEDEAGRAERLAARLRDLGVDPDAID